MYKYNNKKKKLKLCQKNLVKCKKKARILNMKFKWIPW